MAERTPVRDFYGKILGFIEEDRSGDKVARDFYGRILGRYDHRNDVTRDFYGRIVCRGDYCSGLITQNTN